MYTTKNTKCSNFTCEIRTICQRSKVEEHDIEVSFFCFAYSKRLKKCNSFIPKN